ncbi:hypothetical protein L596_018655 [Steinernema carpocapsae]|uniref:Uncharacterized protein n=1 Tax=Steinernema carpocapsae TaxID=34508 RepID=A0A4U5N5I7_STECR|nr:hypothetical protein L596_018655 [Steinernema carpocapsae]
MFFAVFEFVFGGQRAQKGQFSVTVKAKQIEMISSLLILSLERRLIEFRRSGRSRFIPTILALWASNEKFSSDLFACELQLSGERTTEKVENEEGSLIGTQ